MRKSFLCLITLLAVLWMAGRVYAQAELAPEPKRNRNNSLEINFVLHEFFDRNPIVQTRYRGIPGWTNLSYGITYGRKFGRVHGLEATAKVIGIIYWDVGVNPKPPGWVESRLGWWFDLLYVRKLAAVKKSELFGLLGASYRHGDEHQVASYGLFDMHLEFYTLRDPGITGGLRGVQLLPWNFQVSGEVKYTFYVYRHTKPREYMRPYTDGTTRHLLTMQLGIGYRF